ncbi:MAG TPA: squalene/phytoene synthase family protein [Polyangia bacterium]|jgi:farnesyl-diphosphate farnesyltransferase|nr:squalene/phytoene synthase family protein [Polyangia bacterium]
MESSASSSSENQSQNRRSGLEPLLQKTSRTFALTIPLLPDPLRTEVAVAYLLFRIIDTFEDATRWNGGRRADALGQFVRLIDGGDLQDAQGLTAQWLSDPPLEHPGYLELLAATPRVLEWSRGLRPGAREQLRLHLGRSARGMAEVVARAGDHDMLQLQTLQDLRDYCYTVAGIVGEMLTELFLLQSPALMNAAAGLRERAVAFGEGLQLVNILKDARPDASEGRVYLPQQATLAEVFMLARADLRSAAEYTDLLRSAGGERGLVAFNALNSRLAIGTLRLLRDKGLGAKLTRLQVTTIAAQVMHAVETGGVLFPESP